MLLKNRQGFSLVEIMIAFGVIGAITLIVMNIVSMTKKSQSKFEFDTEVTTTTNEIIGILSDEVRCLNTFKALVKPESIDGKFFINKTFGNAGISITGYSLSGIAPDGLLTISYKNKQSISNTGDTKNKTINMYIEGAPGNITKCRSQQKWSNDIWNYGEGNDIFYNGGIRLGDETQANKCDEPSEGTMRFNKSKHVMEYCSNIQGDFSWTAVISSCRSQNFSNQQTDTVVTVSGQCSDEEVLTGAYGGCVSADIHDNLYDVSTDRAGIIVTQNCSHALAHKITAKLTITCCK